MILEKLIEINLQVLSLTDILKLSECNKNIHQIVWNHIKYFLTNKEKIFPCQTMFSIKSCNSCNYIFKDPSESHQLCYTQDDLPRRYIIVCKNKWQCKLHGLYARNIDSRRQGNFYSIKKLLQPYTFVKIPRSNGSFSSAKISALHVVHIRKNGKVFCDCDWMENGFAFKKLVPIEDCQPYPHVLTEFTETFLVYLSERLNDNVITVIKKFLCGPEKISFKLFSQKWFYEKD